MLSANHFLPVLICKWIAAVFLGHIRFCLPFAVLQKAIFSPDFTPPVVTCKRCDLTLSTELMHNSDAITKIPSLLCLEKEITSWQWNSKYGVSQRNLPLRILIAHLPVGLITYHNIIASSFWKPRAIWKAVMTLHLTHSLHNTALFTHTTHLHQQADSSRHFKDGFAAFRIFSSRLQVFLMHISPWFCSVHYRHLTVPCMQTILLRVPMGTIIESQNGLDWEEP